MYNLSQTASAFQRHSEDQEEDFESYEQHYCREHNYEGPRIWCVDPFAKEEEEDCGPLTLERYFQQRDARKARLEEKARKEREIHRLNENWQKWNQPFDPPPYETSCNSHLEPNINPPLDKYLQDFDQSSDSLLDENSSDSFLKSEKNPLKNLERESELDLSSEQTQFPDIQSDENSNDLSSELNINPLENFGRTSAFENEINYPLKNLEQESELNLSSEQTQSPNLQSYGKSTNSTLKSNANPLLEEYLQSRARTPNIQSDENSTNSTLKSNANPLLEEFSQSQARTPDIQSDEKSNNPPPKSNINPLRKYDRESLLSFICGLFLKMKCGADSQPFASLRKFFQPPPGMNRFKPP